VDFGESIAVGYLDIRDNDDLPFTTHVESKPNSVIYHVLNGCWDFEVVNGKAHILDEQYETKDVGYFKWFESVGLYNNDEIAKEYLKLWEENV
jgi:hypothetical protein